MPQPLPGAVHVKRWLTDMSISYEQELDVFIAPQVFPGVPVDFKSDLYIKFPKGYAMRDDMRERPLGGNPAQIGFGLEEGTFNCTEWSLEYPIDDRLAKNQDRVVELEMRATRNLTEKGLIHRDKLWAERYFKKGVWDTNWSGVSASPNGTSTFLQFNDSGSEPVKFWDARATEMRKKTGKRPNKLVLGADVYTVLKNHPEVLERIKYTQKPPAVVTTDILAELFDVERVLVAEGVENTAPEGAADAVEFIVDPKSAFLCYAAKSPSILEPSAGYTFGWTKLIPGFDSATGGAILSGRDERASTTWVQIKTAYDMQPTATDLGMFFEDAVTEA